MPKDKSKKTGVVMVIAVGGKPPKKAEKTSDVKKADMCAQCNMKRLPSGACAGCRAKERSRGSVAQGAVDRREGKTQAAPQTTVSTLTPEQEDPERERMKGNLKRGAPLDLSWRLLKKKTHV